VVPATPAQFSQPPSSTSTRGLILPVNNLVLTVGNPTGSDSVSSRKETVTLHTDVLFQFDKSNLTPKAHQVLATVATQVKSRAVGPVQVTGYTDSIGTDAVNIPLSQARAQSVAGALRPQTPGVPYRTAGLGAADPVAPNTKPDGSDNPAGRALNRRVTIAFAVKAPAKPKPPPTTTPSAPSSGAAGSLPRSVTYQANVRGIGVDTYQVTLQRLVRSGDLVVLELAVTCQGGADQQCDSDDWSATSTVPPIPTNQANAQQTFETVLNTLTGVYLVDPATGSEYIPVTDPFSTPLVDAIAPFVHQGESYTAWAYFPAPPSTTNAVTVVLPGGSPRVPGVPIAASAP
jgi:outer membrane protein OmpA-like peptidoglycan-associated protein